ncbi:unnamed protein product [Ambrosiozyma monospora]|uniref:Unnamed protein product n=1 Tax=Ambrosiozyma monospora TaxID=43982 RepID=A0ACB5U7Z2_AMBMO|nr:unnamed protein product [Ambrosiozyma monospora]
MVTLLANTSNKTSLQWNTSWLAASFEAPVEKPELDPLGFIEIELPSMIPRGLSSFITAAEAEAPRSFLSFDKVDN